MEKISVLCVIIFCTYEDMKARSLSPVWLGVFGSLGIGLQLFTKELPLTSILGGIGIGGALILLSIITHEEMGVGDGLLFIVIGIYLGFMDTLILLWTAGIICGCAGVSMVIFQKKDWKYELPFVPFVLMGYLVDLSVMWLNR